MKSYILFIYANFENHEELEYFCMEHFSQVSEAGIKYVIENLGSCIIIFDSEKDKETLTKDLRRTMDIEHIKFYLIFEKESIFWAELPPKLNDFIFKPQEPGVDAFKITIQKLDRNFDLDEILEKIQDSGFDSLTEDEKNFLEGFGK